MSRADRIEKSDRARSRRKTVKQIKETLQKRMFARLKNNRKKLQKINKRRSNG